MQAYHGQEAIKEQFVAQMQAHHDADEIVHGTYWRDGKGCAVGCIAHAHGDVAHEKVAKMMDVPIQLAYLIDDIFEALPNGHAKAFPLRFLKAIRPGADLSRIWVKFAHWLLTDPTLGMLALPDLADDVKIPTTKIAELIGIEAADGTLTSEQIAEGDAAVRAAWAVRAVRAAWDAWAAWAARDAWDAWDAWAARDARDAWAASAAKRDSVALAQADKLIELLQAA